MARAGLRNWWTDPGYDAVVMQEFETRLQRARTRSRPGYLRAKGAALLRLKDPKALPTAIRLLERVTREWPESRQLPMGKLVDVPWAHELLGDGQRQKGDLPAAEFHYRQSLAKADPNRNGTSKVTELFLAEVLLEKADAASVNEAAVLLSSPHLQTKLLWSAHVFRFCVANARLAAHNGDDPSSWAARALELAADTRPQVRRHPSIGIVQTDERTLTELKSLVGGRALRWS